MRLHVLKELLDSYDDDTVEVEIATSWRKDEWYEIADVEATTNHRDEPVIVINTD